IVHKNKNKTTFFMLSFSHNNVILKKWFFIAIFLKICRVVFRCSEKFLKKGGNDEDECSRD
ncbi:hypothetical protein KKA89_00700, partial [Patescibacteria group bacterium]|nr:hypothetical protein [Patescibacteria group bacterium]